MRPSLDTSAPDEQRDSARASRAARARLASFAGRRASSGSMRSSSPYPRGTGNASRASSRGARPAARRGAGRAARATRARSARNTSSACSADDHRLVVAEDAARAPVEVARPRRRAGAAGSSTDRSARAARPCRSRTTPGSAAAESSSAIASTQQGCAPEREQRRPIGRSLARYFAVAGQVLGREEASGRASRRGSSRRPRCASASRPAVVELGARRARVALAVALHVLRVDARSTLRGALAALEPVVVALAAQHRAALLVDRGDEPLVLGLRRRARAGSRPRRPARPSTVASGEAAAPDRGTRCARSARSPRSEKLVPNRCASAPCATHAARGGVLGDVQTRPRRSRRPRWNR